MRSCPLGGPKGYQTSWLSFSPRDIRPADCHSPLGVSDHTPLTPYLGPVIWFAMGRSLFFFFYSWAAKALCLGRRGFPQLGHQLWKEHLGSDDPWLLSTSELADSCMKFSGFSMEWLRMEQIIWPRIMGFCAIEAALHNNNNKKYFLLLSEAF